jgi:GTP-binding protein
VGKSTLFNRITRSRTALVDDFPGVTRDRHYSDAKWGDREFILVDTGGFLSRDDDRFASEIRFQVHQAIEDADVVVFVLDGKHGISPYDTDLTEILRSVDKPVYHAVNKIDNIESEERDIFDFYALGVDNIFPVSGEHGYGVADFLDVLTAELPEPPEEEEEEEGIINVAVVGRPNAGKSSLINQILGEKRHVVSDVAGTTRDSVDSLHTVNGKTYRFVDTAGIRRKGKVSEKIEKYSIIKALRSLDRCDVALILIDSSEGVTDQDITVAGYANDRGCGCIFVLNKWDLVDKDTKTAKRYFDDLYDHAKFLQYAPAITISALSGRRVPKVFSMIDDVYDQYTMRINTGTLNKIVERAIERTEPPMHKGKRLKFYYATQVASKPPTFVFFVNYPEAVHFSYRRYLINQLREMLELDKTPISILFRQRSGKINFAELKNENTHGRKKDGRDKESRNKEKKKRERKKQSQRKLQRDGAL